MVARMRCAVNHVGRKLMENILATLTVTFERAVRSYRAAGETFFLPPRLSPRVVPFAAAALRLP